MPIQPLPIFTYYDRQRFTQFGAMDCANWYGIQVETGKKQQALYPAMGRQHVNFLNQNRLIFDAEPREIFRTINFMYVIVGTRVFQYDKFYNEREIGSVSLTGSLSFAYLPVQNTVYALLTDETSVYIITENPNGSYAYDVSTGANTPTKPQSVAAFGNRFVVATKDTPVNTLTQINLGGVPLVVANIFTIPDGGAGFALFFSSTGIVRQYAVLHSQLYIFTDFTTDILANIATQITVGNATREFPWKVNTSYNWDYGIADRLSLSVDFGRMVFLAKNSNGLVSFMMSNGGQPQDISSQAVNILLEQEAGVDDGLSPFLRLNSDGFLYQYENTVFYRVSAGIYDPTQLLDPESSSANSIEFNFETGKWGRVIELNGTRCRIQKHVYFANKHLVTVQADTAMYEMAGTIYHNELRTPNTTSQASNAFTKYPIRYELVTQQLYLDDYAEFIDDYVEIDFVFGNQSFYKSTAPFNNTVFIVDAASTPEIPIYLVDENSTTENPIFLIEDGTNTPTFDDTHYNALFKPHIELYYSDDGGVTFLSADLREFSTLGQYRWRMRWYELGVSRNRCYKLICVSSAPIVILGAVRNTRRASGGAN
jgi:hypothetical protein